MPSAGLPNARAAKQLERWRADTPGAARRVHLNNAGAALMPRPVHDAVAAHLARELELGGYEAAESAADPLATAYADLARLIGARRRNLAVAASSTAAFAQALGAFDFAPGDRILTTRADYASNQIMYLSLARRCGVEIIRAADLPVGGVDADSVRELLRRARPRLVAVTWVPTNSGLIQDVEAVGELCEAAGVPYLLDACQAVGQFPVDVARLRCDYLAATARKFLRGPRGIGFLYVSDRALEGGAYPLLVDLYGATWTDPDEFELAPDARRFEYWERPDALLLGLGAAARYALEVGLETIQTRAFALAALLRERLDELPDVELLDRGRKLCAIVTADLRGKDAAAVKLELRRRGINTSSFTRSSAVIDMDWKGVRSALRLSPHYYNTEDEIERAVREVEKILKKDRRGR
jgi:selenocysteine lyase/cysteine desulfurase